jgi:coenzyme F420 hydrogenase subunit alpha
VGKEAKAAPLITSRICGLCQITHSIASAKAIERACNLEVPPEAEVLREILGLTVRIYNNLLHQIVVSEDLFPERIKQLSFIKLVQKVRKFTGELLEAVGGEIIHSPNVVVGGISEPLEEFVREKILSKIEEAEKALSESFGLFREGLDELWEREGLPQDLGKHNLPFFATDRFYGGEVKLEDFQFKLPQEILPVELKGRASNLFPLYKGQIVETGPRARKALFGGYNPKGGVKELHILRGEENLEALKRIGKLLEENDFSGELWNRQAPTGDGETLGVGVHEAPRGTNIHAVSVDSYGKIVSYKIVVPTEINMGAISAALEGELYVHSEFIVRGYDPCIVCAAH